MHIFKASLKFCHKAITLYRQIPELHCYLISHQLALQFAWVLHQIIHINSAVKSNHSKLDPAIPFNVSFQLSHDLMNA